MPIATAPMVVASTVSTSGGRALMTLARASAIWVVIPISGPNATSSWPAAIARWASVVPPWRARSRNCANPSLPFRLVAHWANASDILTRPPVALSDAGKKACMRPPKPTAKFLMTVRKLDRAGPAACAMSAAHCLNPADFTPTATSSRNPPIAFAAACTNGVNVGSRSRRMLTPLVNTGMVSLDSSADHDS